MPIKNNTCGSNKKEMGFYINGENSISEYLKKLEYVLKMYDRTKIISINGKIDVVFIEEDVMDDKRRFCSLDILLHKIKVLRNLMLKNRAFKIVFKPFLYFKHIILLF